MDNSNTSELAGLNLAIDRQLKIVKEPEDRSFLEQLRLATLKVAGERVLRRETMSDGESNDTD
jgi:hypothetical protein